MSQIDVHKQAVRLHDEGTAFCIVTIVAARGSIPQEIGARAIFGTSGLISGTIGGGRIEVCAGDRCRELLASSSAPRLRLDCVNLTKDIGMTCAGEMTLLYEVHRPDFEWNVVIFGAGHVSQKLCRLALELDCRISCIDTRKEWLDRLPDHSRLQRFEVADFAEGIKWIPPRAFILVLTMGHTTDLPVLRAIAQHRLNPAFIGTLGSASKAAILRRELDEAGVPEDFIQSIHCPIGDRIGNNTPPEIAVSVLAQMLRVRGEPR